MASNEFVVPAQYEDLTPAPNVDKKTLNRMVWRSYWLQSSFNYETMQSGGWLFAMVPGLEKVHTNKNDLSASMYHNLDFINTHPFLVTFVMGIVLSLEQNKVDTQTIRSVRISAASIVLSLEQNKVDTQTIRSVRISAASPLGGIGDALFWLTLVPITAGITSNMAIEGNIIAPLIFLVVFHAALFACRFGLMNWAYKMGTSAIDSLTSNMQAFTRAAAAPLIFLVVFHAALFACRFGLMNWAYKMGTSAIDSLTSNMQAFTRAAAIMGCFVVGALTVNMGGTQINLNIPNGTTRGLAAHTVASWLAP